LPGLAVEITDRAGFFRLRRFVPARQLLTILPWMIRPQTTATVVKPHNVQRVAGHHAYRRAGLSAELLGIRDYQAGDPPRTIAWKPTARTGRFMSREFEMEVPVRVTLFGGLPPWLFSERPETSAGDRVIAAAASLARLLLADRDPVALVLASDRGASRLPHAGGNRQLVRILHRLLDVADRAGGYGEIPETDFESAVLEAVSRRFPSMLDSRFNALPPLRMSLRPEVRRRALVKRRLGLALAQLLSLPPGQEFRLASDSRLMADACRRYAAKFGLSRARHQRSRAPSIDQQSDLANQLARCLIQARSRARDHELYVVMSEFSGNPRIDGRLIDAIRVCRAAHHRVIAVRAVPLAPLHAAVDPTVAMLARRGLLARADASSSEWSRELVRIGVRSAELRDPRLMQVVVNELELIRASRSRSIGLARHR
jgi:uncharacterized protein (DUF58 family)